MEGCHFEGSQQLAVFHNCTLSTVLTSALAPVDALCPKASCYNMYHVYRWHCMWHRACKRTIKKGQVNGPAGVIIKLEDNVVAQKFVVHGALCQRLHSEHRHAQSCPASPCNYCWPGRCKLTLWMPVHTTKPLPRVLQTMALFRDPAQFGSPVTVLSKACVYRSARGSACQEAILLLYART